MAEIFETYGTRDIITTREILDKNKINPKDKQVGGTHYKDMPIQPSEYISKNGIGWYEGNAIKYLTRHKAKGQKADLEKAIHYIELAIQEHYG